MSKPIDQRIRQSVCARCGRTVRPGSGIVLDYGSGGRIHAKECPVLEQEVIRTGMKVPEDTSPLKELAG